MDADEFVKYQKKKYGRTCFVLDIPVDGHNYMLTKIMRTIIRAL